MYTYEKGLKDSMSPVTRAETTTPWQRSDTDDVALMLRIADQDHGAFELLYKRYAPRLSSFLFPWLQDAALVDEAMNAAMLVVWQKASRFQPTMKLSTWLFGIARNKALRILKTSIRQSPSCLATERVAGQAGPEDLCIQQQQAQMVTQAVRLLPPHLRDVVEGVYYQTLTYPELANCLGCSVSTVKSRMESARRRLAVQLRPRYRMP